MKTTPTVNVTAKASQSSPEPTDAVAPPIQVKASRRGTWVILAPSGKVLDRFMSKDDAEAALSEYEVGQA